MASRTPPRKHLPTPPAPGTTSPAPPTVVDQQANPAGPPEGTDHGHAGAGGEGAPTPVLVDPTPTLAAQQPEVAWEGPGSPTGRLIAFLRTHYPEETGKVVVVGGTQEHPADTAVRLLTRLAARGTAVPRCTEAYCNRPSGHTDEHGWVHTGG